MTYIFSNVIVVSLLDLETETNRASSPRRYWPWVNSFPQFDLRTVTDREVKDRIVILGGGALLDEKYKDQLDMIASSAKEVHMWGVGINSRGVEYDAEPLDWDIVQTASLVGLRDRHMTHPDVEIWSIGCPSVMHPMFAHPPDPVINAVAYIHDDYEFDSKQRFVKAKVPIIHTNSRIDDALYHIARARCVFTTSYHGAMWAAWMGRQVILLDPFSSKFFTGLKADTISDGKPGMDFNMAGREWYQSVIRSHREFERFIGGKITLEPF